jgi:lipopolysaccharide/colanic/teichoic acid biosynthesis glycosyltransferase
MKTQTQNGSMKYSIGSTGMNSGRSGINIHKYSLRGMALRRFVDLLVATISLLLLSPMLLLISLVVWLRLGRPILFCQQRPGLHGQSFTLIKFRTMADIRDSQGNLLPDSARLTPLGRFLRTTSLDELPELFNVLKGDMSLVGPRPLLMEYLDRYTPTQMRRHEVKPGITGWAQVHGRNNLTWEEKFALDLWYVDHQSVWLDFKTIALTIWKILGREGINPSGQDSMPEFLGKEARGLEPSDSTS